MVRKKRTKIGLLFNNIRKFNIEVLLKSKANDYNIKQWTANIIQAIFLNYSLKN